MSPFDLIKKIYLKKEVTEDELNAIEFGTNVVIIKTLAQNPDNLEVLKKAVQLQFFIEPKHLFIMIYASIKKVYRVPFFKIPKAIKEEEQELYKAIQKHFFWSDKELAVNMPFLNFLSSDVEYWNEQFGITTKKKRKK